MAGPSGNWQLKKLDSGKVYGALPMATLKQWILEARVDPADPVKGPGMAAWAPAGQVGELARFFAPQAAGGDRVSGGDVQDLFPRRREEPLDIDITPFIDCTFLLLIFFVVTAQFGYQAMKINPPTAKNTESRRQEKLVIVITKDGRLFIGQTEHAVANLGQAIRAEMQRTEQQSVVIRGDRESHHGLFVTVLDKCKEANVRHIFVGATKETGQ